MGGRAALSPRARRWAGREATGSRTGLEGVSLQGTVEGSSGAGPPTSCSQGGAEPAPASLPSHSGHPRPPSGPWTGDCGVRGVQLRAPLEAASLREVDLMGPLGVLPYVSGSWGVLLRMPLALARLAHGHLPWSAPCPVPLQGAQHWAQAPPRARARPAHPKSMPSPLSGPLPHEGPGPWIWPV